MKLNRLTAAAVLSMIAGAAHADDTLHIVGSSTVAPFSRATTDHLNNNKAKIEIEATGTNGGMRLFCSSAAESSPDIANASRPMTDDERAYCAAHGVLDVVQFTLGYDGIVLANAINAPQFSLTPRQLFFALANETPVDEETCRMERNRTARWSDVDSSLPRVKIQVYGPPVTSGTRDSFLDHAIAVGAKTVPCLARLSEEDPEAFADYISLLREDGRWIDAGENDHAIAQTIANSHEAIGIFGYSFLVEGRSTIKPVLLNGVEPTVETITSGAYPLARPIFFYVKEKSVPREPYLRPYLYEIFSDAAYGENGYLRKLGLVPLPKDRVVSMQKKAEALCNSLNEANAEQ